MVLVRDPVKTEKLPIAPNQGSVIEGSQPKSHKCWNPRALWKSSAGGSLVDGTRQSILFLKASAYIHILVE